MITQKRQTVYSQLAKLSRPYIKAFSDDLKIDREMIRQNPGVPFLHYTRETGTHLYTLPPADSKEFPPLGQKIPYVFGSADRYHILKGTVQCVRSCADDGDYHKLILYFNGKTLRQITHREALEIAYEWEESIRKAWNA